eukprot:gene10534-2661_t
MFLCFTGALLFFFLQVTSANNTKCLLLEQKGTSSCNFDKPTYGVCPNLCLLLNLGWVRFENSVYLYYRSNRIFSRSEDYCNDRNATLVIINSSEEMEFVHNTMMESHRVPIWLGAVRTENDMWEWIDGSPWDFEFWIPGEPNNKGGIENCLRAGHLS